MKTGRVVMGLFVLLVTIVGPWMVEPATSQETFRARGWALINFERAPAESAATLWADAGNRTPLERRWQQEKRAEERPVGAAILRISLLEALLNGGPWDAIVLIGAGSEKELLAAARYLEQFYTHVEIYGIRGEKP